MGSAPGLAPPRLVRARGAGGCCRRVLVGGDVQPLNVGAVLPLPLFQMFCRIRLRSVWSVRSSSCVLRGGGAAQSPCGRQQSGHDHKFAMHGLQNQCSCSVPPQPSFVVHLHADPAWIPRPRMWSFTFGQPEEGYCFKDDRVSTREGARALRAVRRQVLGGRRGPVLPVRIPGRGAVAVHAPS